MKTESTVKLATGINLIFIVYFEILNETKNVTYKFYYDARTVGNCCYYFDRYDNKTRLVRTKNNAPIIIQKN